MYPRITCVNASREVILRFTTLRNFEDIACDCRTIDFLALMAAMTLLIAHLEGQRLENGNLLAHQYLSDRALIEQVHEVMERLHQLYKDTLSAQSARLLQRLLLVEPGGGQLLPTSSALGEEEDDIAVSVQTPYSAIIKIAREGLAKKASHLEEPSRIERIGQWQTTCSTFTPDSLVNATVDNPYAVAPGPLIVPPFPQEDFSAPNEDIDEWALQGVDLAFFDSLMRSTVSE